MSYALKKIEQFFRINKLRERLIPPGAHVIAPHMVWKDQEFYKAAAERHAGIVGIPDIRCFFLQSCLQSVAGVLGHVAECGTRNGKSALFMLEVLPADRKMFLFDSFEGLSDPTPGIDPLDSAIKPGQTKRVFHNEDLDGVYRRFSSFDNAQIMKGWIPERFPDVAAERFCFVHVDVDLYQPTKDSLEFFYDRLSQHGILVCDDYGSSAYPGSRQAMDEFFASRSETPIELPQGQAFIVKR